MRIIQMAMACVAVTVATGDHLQAAIVTKINSTDGFFDNSNGTRGFSFSSVDFGAGSTTVTDVNLSVFFAKSNNDSFVPEGTAITSGNAFFNEFEFVLTSPSGTSFTLISNVGDVETVSADNFATFANFDFRTFSHVSTSVSPCFTTISGINGHPTYAGMLNNCIDTIKPCVFRGQTVLKTAKVELTAPMASKGGFYSISRRRIR